MEGIAPAPAASPPAPGWALSNVGASGLTAASVVVLFLYLTCRFLLLYNKEATEAAAASSSPSPPPRRRAVAVPVSALPVFVHVVAAAAGEERAACAVCLAEFAAGDAGRLLPRCGHGFHEACIATWLRVSTTCPLCRAPVLVPVGPAAK